MSHLLGVFKSPLHGDGVKTTQNITKDEILYSEAPALLLQSINNRQDALVCSHCSRFIGSVDLQLDFLQKRTDRLRLSDQNSVAVLSESRQNAFGHLSDICPCMLSCGELYCGEMCRRMHWELKGHFILCTGQLTEDTVAESPLYQFKLFSIQTNEIFLLIAEMIAGICAIQDRGGSEGLAASSEAIIRFNSFVQNQWWEVATATKKGKAKAKLEKSLKTLVKDAHELLQDVFNLEARGLSTIINEDFISRTIGMFEQNNVGVRLRNPVAEFVSTLENDDPRINDVLDVVNNIRADIESQEDCEDEYEDIESRYDDEDNKTNDELVAVKSETIDNDEKVTNLSEVVTGKKAELAKIIQEVGEDNLFPPLDGTAFYMLICKINHSCDPNVCVKYTTDPVQGLVAQLVAIRDIEAGEELVQSYIDQALSTKERQDALRDYGFQCSCVRCTFE